MPLKPLLVAMLGVAACLHLASASATNSIWPARATAPSAMVADYRTLSCVKEPPQPYTGSLQLKSKYDQSDASKSTLAANPDQGTEEIAKQVKAFIGGLIYATKQFERAKNPQQANMALACQDQWLETWAKAGALLNRDASSSGMAARKWAVAAISGTLLMTEAVADNKLVLSPVQKDWLARLGELIIEEYQPRHAQGFAYFNNHDYWAGWAVSATGMLIQRDDFLRWGDTNLRRGLQQATLSSAGDYAYLPLEVARSKLAATYSQYALVPLVMLAETARSNNLGWSADDQSRLELLANFAARSVLDPKGLPELQGQSQVDVAPYKMAWLIPFLQRSPQHELARKLYDSLDGDVDNYSQLGGPLKPLYSTGHTAKDD